MKNASILLLIGVLCVAALSASAENYKGDYGWLRFWDGVTVSTSATSGTTWKGTWGGAGWNGTNGSVPGTAWLAGTLDVGDLWYEITWTESMTLTGAQVQARSDQHGRRNNLGDYRLEYWYEDKKNPQNSGWKPIGLTGMNDPTNTPLTLTGFNDYSVRFLNSVTTTAIRVFIPKENYDHNLLPTWTNQSEALWPGPGISKFLPIGNLASGKGLDPSNPSFNLLATNPGDHFLGTNFKAYSLGNVNLVKTAGLSGFSPTAMLTDGNVHWDSPRTGWGATFTGNEGFVCDLGTEELMVHSITVYGGTGMTFNNNGSMAVYVTDDLANWGTALGRIKMDSTGVLTLSNIDTYGRYVILADPVNNNFIFATEIAINAFIPVPEPATMTLLALGGLALLRRK